MFGVKSHGLPGGQGDGMMMLRRVGVSGHGARGEEVVWQPFRVIADKSGINYSRSWIFCFLISGSHEPVPHAHDLRY